MLPMPRITRRHRLALALCTMLVAAPVAASTEEAKPLAPAPQSPSCEPGATNEDGSPADNACPPESASPPVNTIEDIYGAGAIGALLAPPAKQAPPAEKPAKPAKPRPRVPRR